MSTTDSSCDFYSSPLFSLSNKFLFPAILLEILDLSDFFFSHSYCILQILALNLMRMTLLLIKIDEKNLNHNNIILYEKILKMEHTSKNVVGIVA